MNAENLQNRDALQRAFKGKLDDFASDYGLNGKPAIVWQAMPAEVIHVDVLERSLQKALQHGSRSEVTSPWWNGFYSTLRTVPVFDGLAAHRAAASSLWMTEIHEDGHLIAGVWNFPATAAGPCVGEFFQDAFLDFGVLAHDIYAATSHAGGLYLTCMMQNANRLPMADKWGREIARAPNRETLRWPILELSNSEGLASSCKRMGAQFLRAYGQQA